MDLDGLSLNSDDDEAAAAAVVAAAAAWMQDVEDEEEEERRRRRKVPRRHGGSRRGKGRNLKRDFAGAHERVVNHYFRGEASFYNEETFERRFRCPRVVVDRVWQALEGCDPFILKRQKGTSEPGIRPLVRFVACMRMLAYGDCADRLDEGLQMSESASRDSLKDFCRLVVEKFDGYLNKCPSAEHKTKVLELMGRRGFPGCFASWDCKHYFWQNCPLALAGQYKGKGGGKTIVMEAICDPFLYIWYFNFGAAGSLNDINILDRSSIVAALLSGRFDNKVAPYTINGRRRDWMYFLVDGIYPCWSIFVKTHQNPTSQVEFKFSKRQEHVRKDIERCFGILVKKFGILKHHLRGWHMDELRMLVNCCVILHNMTQEVRRDQYTFSDEMEVEEDGSELENEAVESIFLEEENQVGEEAGEALRARVAHMCGSLEDATKHVELREDLMEHILRKH